MSNPDTKKLAHPAIWHSLVGNFLYKQFLIAIVMVIFSGNGAAAIPETADSELRILLTQAINDSNSFEDRYEAEVWLLDMSKRMEQVIKNPADRFQLLKTIHYEAARAGLPPELVLAVIEVESDFDRWAISEAGAQGLMQVMPFWLSEIGHPDDNLFHPRTNLRLGCTILRYYLDKEQGDLPRALARYNGSTGTTVYSDKVIDALSTRWFRQ